MTSPYDFFKSAVTGSHWKRIGLKRRAGVSVPLFSLYSKESIGIGEFPDLKLLVDWCVQARLSIVQLLPLNDTGFDYRPYDSQSSFALEPMYLSVRHLKGVPKPDREMLEKLRDRFPPGLRRVNYMIKRAKLEYLRETFDHHFKGHEEFDRFKEVNGAWLEDYALFKAGKAKFNQSGWFDWPDDVRSRKREALKQLRKEAAADIQFYEWLQWQCYEQLREVKRYADGKKVFLMGDLPFLVSRDSSDTWAHQNYFKLELSSGAPPDGYNPNGQRWGMPPYRWEEIELHGYDYLKQKLGYAENFYHMYRIDHAIGVFRIFTFSLNGDPQAPGVFDPADTALWEEYGKKILRVMLDATEMLPCAEDLGAVPDCSYKTLREFALPGMDIQRWQRDWHHGSDFLKPGAYRPHSIAALSTHDMATFTGWWINEASEDDKHKYAALLEVETDRVLDMDVKSLLKRALMKVNESASIFSVQLLQDWLSLENLLSGTPDEWRINRPGTSQDNNWSVIMPLSLEDMVRHPVTKAVRELNRKTLRE